MEVDTVATFDSCLTKARAFVGKVDSRQDVSEAHWVAIIDIYQTFAARAAAGFTTYLKGIAANIQFTDTWLTLQNPISTEVRCGLQSLLAATQKFEDQLSMHIKKK